jgi:hypothetical protein
MKTSYQELFGALFLTFTACLCQSASAAPQVVWRIGTFNESPSEFNTGKQGPPLFGSRYPKGELIYIVGKSRPETDWPGYQEGAAAGKPGNHAYIIQFNLDEVPLGVYTLKAGLLSETARVAELQVEINGHAGLFYQHPKLNYGGGDRDMVTLPIAAADTIVFDLPTQYLQKGTNRLALTAVDEPTGEGEEGHSAIAYDALELEHDAARTFAPRAITADVEPTIFYVGHGAALSELVDVYVRHNSAIRDGQVTLTIGGQEFHQPLASKEFGEQRVEFSVPEFTAPVGGAVTVKMNGHSQRFPVTVAPARKWNLMVVPHIHVDIGYSDYQEKTAEIQSRVLEEAIQLIQEHPDFRYSPDGFWSVRQYMAGRSEERQQRLFQMVRDKKIFIPTVEANLLTGFPSLETLIRSLYPAFEFHQQHGGDADYADITDVPSYSWSYASVMAAAGLKYFIAGCDNDNGPILLASRLNEKSPFWWEGPDGGRILMWYAWVYAQLAVLFGGMQGEIAAGHDAIPIFLQAYMHPEYKSDSVIVYGTQWENTDLFPRQASIADDWNKLYAYPHLQYSGFSDAMRTIAAGFGDSIPVVRGDGGPYWEDGIVSTARSAAIDRESEQRALAAEEFSTISGLVDPGSRAEPEVLKRLWNNMVLYDEHTWGAAGSVSDPQSRETIDQLAVKEAFATDAKRDIDYVLRRSLADLANSIYDPMGTLLVFNPLSWQRTSLAEMDLDKGRELVDLATHQPVSYEVLSTGASYRHIRLLAQDVPPVGYKAYSLKEIPDATPAPQPVSGGTLENQFYRIVLDAEGGAVKSIFDKQLNRELVNGSSPYRFDQYLYVTGGDQTPNRILEYSATWPIPQLTMHNSTGGRIVSVTNEPFGMTAHLESSGVNTPQIQTEVILFNGQKKIEFINHVHKTEVYSKEAVYFAFPLAMSQPRFRYETQNGFVDPAHDLMPGAGKEWFSVQHWVAADQGGMAAAIIPVDASLITLGDIMRGEWPREFGQRPGTIFSQVMNNYYYTNYAAGQGGNFTFRYVLTSGSNLDPALLSRLGREEMSPLELDQITSADKAINSPRPLAAAQGSFLHVDQPDVALVTWKLAEDGDGMILRFLELAGKSAAVSVESPLLDVKAAWMADALERNQGPLPYLPHGFRFDVKPFQIVTVRVEETSGVK